MDSSLEFLLQTLVNTPEEDNRALMRAAVSLLREICTSQSKSSYPKFQKTAEKARGILDQILLGKVDNDEEEDFLESGDSAETSIESIKTNSTSLAPPAQTPSTLPELNSLAKMIEDWNSAVEPWLQIHYLKDGLERQIVSTIKSVAALRNNLTSTTHLREFQRAEIRSLDKHWKAWQEEMEKEGYQVFPSQFGKMEEPVGNVIYTCRPKLPAKEIVLLTPGLKKNKDFILTPLSLVIQPAEEPYPADHPDRNLPPQWRGILGELEILIHHIEIQHSVVCSIESIYRSAIESVKQNQQVVIGEIKRRAEAFRTALVGEDNIYRLATNYWRLEECFWSVFHDDGRPEGYSIFERLSRRVQGWRAIIKKENNLYLRDFQAGKDSLASINKYIDNVILKSSQGVQPGTVLRELRPAIVVKVNNVTRLLKGRVICT